MSNQKQNYDLNIAAEGNVKSGTWAALLKLINLLPDQRGRLMLALLAIIAFAVLSMLPPALIGFTLNNILSSHSPHDGLHILGWTFLRGSGYPLVLTVCSYLIVIYLLNLGAV